jgi:protein SCO1/2
MIEMPMIETDWPGAVLVRLTHADFEFVSDFGFRALDFMRMVAFFVLLLIPSASGAQIPASTVGPIEGVALEQHLDEQLPLDLIFRDETGKQVRLGDFFGDKPVIVNLVYFRCPMLCTQVLNGLLRSMQGVKFTVGEDYQVVSVSIDPRETTEMAAAKKKQYAGRYRRPGADEGWHFLTGDEQNIERLAKAVGFRYRYDKLSDQYAHASGIMVATPQGRLSRYFYGIDYPPNDLRLGLVESSENKIGSPVDQILLLCFHYDPRTGKYGLVISTVIRIAGVATVLGLGSFLWAMYRLERRRTAALAAGDPGPGSFDAIAPNG